jgi:hypothetical protein
MKFTRLPSGSNGRGTSRTVFFEMIDHSPTAADDPATQPPRVLTTVAAAVAVATVVINERRFIWDLPPSCRAASIGLRLTWVNGVGEAEVSEHLACSPAVRATKLGDYRSVDLGEHLLVLRSPVGIVVSDSCIEAGLARVVRGRTLEHSPG